MSYIKLTALYPNKWRFYVYPLISKNNKILSFNWFICSRPQEDTHGNLTLELSRYTNFFDESTGYTYHITFDATEVEPCKVLVGNFDKDIEKSIKLGYHGIASQTSKNCSCDILCKNAEFIIEKSVLEKSNRCPYIEFAKSHHSILKKEHKNFPSLSELNNAKPGKFTLKIKTMIDIYLNNLT